MKKSHNYDHGPGGCQGKPIFKKRLGQHFLKDTGTLARLAAFIAPSQTDVVVEIGAGTGTLTALLARQAAHLIAIEIDPDCIHRLEAALADRTNVTVIREDILKLDVERLVKPHLSRNKRLLVAGNLPYNIATAVIERMLRLRLRIREMVFLLQLEVAERITASPGSRPYGYFSVYCQHYCEPHMGFQVAPACFVPRPKVVSAVVRLTPRPGRWSAALERSFEQVVKAAFAHRRKTLANSMSYHAAIGPVAHAILREAGIDGTLRPEQIPVCDYERLARIYHESASCYTCGSRSRDR